MALLGYWLLTEATGTSRADGSGNGLTLADNNSDYPFSATSWSGDGSLYGTGFTPTNNSYLLRTDANLPATFPGKNAGSGIDYTVYVRFRTGGNTAVSRWLITKWVTGLVGAFRIFHQASNNIVADHYNSSSVAHSIVWTLPDTTNFHSVVLRWQGGTDDEVAGFLNGTKSGTTHTVSTIKTSTGGLEVGNVQGTTRFFLGYIDEIAIWDEALSDAQIASLHSLGIYAFLNPAVGRARMGSSMLGGPRSRQMDAPNLGG
jgi:Concanavalin A-like lectin/glucanases superfamily